MHFHVTGPTLKLVCFAKFVGHQIRNLEHVRTLRVAVIWKRKYNFRIRRFYQNQMYDGIDGYCWIFHFFGGIKGVEIDIVFMKTPIAETGCFIVDQ